MKKSEHLSRKAQRRAKEERLNFKLRAAALESTKALV